MRRGCCGIKVGIKVMLHILCRSLRGKQCTLTEFVLICFGIISGNCVEQPPLHVWKSTQRQPSTASQILDKNSTKKKGILVDSPAAFRRENGFAVFLCSHIFLSRQGLK